MSVLAGWGNEMSQALTRRRVAIGFVGFAAFFYTMFQLSRRLEVPSH